MRLLLINIYNESEGGLFMNKKKISLALIGLMCLSGASYGAPIAPIQTAEELEQAGGTITIDDVSTMQGPGVAIRHLDRGNTKPFIYNNEVTVKLTGFVTGNTGGDASGIVSRGSDMTLGKLDFNWKNDDQNTENTSHRVYGLEANDGSTLTLGDSSKITLHTNTSTYVVTGIFTNDRQGPGNNAGTIKLGSDTRVEITNEGKSNVYGIWSHASGGGVEAGEGFYLKVTAEQGTATGILSSFGGKVLLNGGTIIANQKNGEGNGIAIQVNEGTLEGNRGIYNISGDIFANNSNKSKADIKFSDESVFVGKATADRAGIINFDMIGTTWNMTGNSTLTSLHFSGAESNINFVGKDEYNTLTTHQLSGEGGRFHMRTDIVGNKSDKLVVGTAGLEGSHLISVKNDGSSATTGKEILTIIETQKDGAIEHFNLTSKVELGGFEYDLKSNPSNSQNLALMATGSSSTGDAGVNLFGGNYMLHYAEMQTLMKRMGDLRDSDREGNIWGRIFGGKMTSEGDGFLRDFDMSYTGIQVGADKKLIRKDGRGTSYVGGFLGYTVGSPSFSRGGDGGIDSYNLGGYWTYKHHNEFYADLVLKYGWMDSDFDIRDSAGQKIDGDLHTNVYSLSMELGRRYHFDQREKAGFYIEPQVQLSIAHFDGDNITASNGLKTKVDAMTSKLARVGTHIGYEVKDGKNPVNVYVKGYFMKEFDGNIDYSFNNGPKRSFSYEDTWFVYGIGATAKMGERHNLFIDFERAEGGRMEQDWALNGGYRYSW